MVSSCSGGNSCLVFYTVFFFFARNCAVLHICRACGCAIRRQSSLVIESYLSRNQLTVELLVTWYCGCRNLQQIQIKKLFIWIFIINIFIIYKILSRKSLKWKWRLGDYEEKIIHILAFLIVIFNYCGDKI